jgi:hypothetical protein
VKVTVSVGDIVIKTQGVEVTVRQIKELTRLAASIALALPTPTIELTQEPQSAPMGFTAHLELASELPTEDYFTDDDE